MILYKIDSIYNRIVIQIKKHKKSLLKNPKLTSALFTQIKTLIGYIEPRIERFVDPSKNGPTRDIWLDKLTKFRKDYTEIINYYK